MMFSSRRTALGLLLVSTSLASSFTASAANEPKLRFQKDLRGDVAVFGSTLAHDCGTKATLPAGATVSCAGQVNITDTAPDQYWRDNVTNSSITALQARTSATLVMPSGAKVVYARLYWAGIKKGSAADTTATLDWLGGPSVTVNADATWTNATNLGSFPDTYYYQASGDATAFISQWSAGDYRVTDVDGIALAGLDLDRAFTGWTLVVFYEKTSEPLRNLALFDGFTYIAPSEGTPKASVTLNGFLVPPGFDAKMTAFTYEGDFDYGGDSFSINAKKAQDALNPVTNFFNSSRSNLGQPVSGSADIPKLSGQPGIMSGYDLDTVDITSSVKAGDTSAVISAESELDIFLLGGFVTSILNKAPEFDFAKKATDLNGGALLPGDEVEYLLTATNNGNDASSKTVITDVLETGLEFVPGSIVLNGQSMSDASDSDRADYNSGSRTITWYVGTGASAGVGGEVAIGSTFTIGFRAKIAADKENGSVANQAVLSASGKSGGKAKEWLSDGDPDTVGPQTTVITIEECQTDKDCNDPTKPHCNPTSFVCESCKSDSDCTNPLFPACQPDGSCNECSQSNDDFCKNNTPVCNVPTGTCAVCTPASASNPGDSTKCQNNPSGTVCVVGNDNTAFCGCIKDSDCGSTKSGKVCDTAASLTCIDGCRGDSGNGCPDGLVCTSKDSSIGKCVTDPEDSNAKCSDGKDNDSDGLVDCADSDCKTSAIDVCRENTNQKCSDGLDNDGDGQKDCDDSDCKTTPAVTVCATENTDADCSDGKDNDNDGKTDCADEDCLTAGLTACGENTLPKCSDGKDNDNDGLVDCADKDCTTVAGSFCGEENSDARCKDGKDNDGDGKVDCDDDGCSKNPAVTVCPSENTAEKCQDKQDNDGDGKVDCADEDCTSVAGVPCGPENTDDLCKDGVDNDGDGKVDCDDTECKTTGPCSDPTGGAENTDAKCSDGKDNDGNGKTDCEEPSCVNGNLGDCGAENTDARCSDGKDNDGDGKDDCADTDCKSTPTCGGTTGGGENTDAKCSDGKDNDGDGKTDCSDSDCLASGISVCAPADSPEVAQDGGCGCAVPGQQAPLGASSLVAGLAAVGLLAGRRRRSAR